jgi:large subunit ribosomal protein L10
MALTKEQKATILEEVTRQLEGASTVYVTNCSGLTVEGVNKLRAKFREKNIGYRVVKNTLLRKAMDRIGGFEGVYGTLDGPTAVAFCNEPAAPARVIKDFSEGLGAGLPKLKSAYVDGAVYDGSALDALVSLKSKTDILGDVIGLLLSPMAQVVGTIQAPSGAIACAVRTLAEREG